MCSIGEEDFGDEGGAHVMVEDLKTMNIEEENCKKCSIQKSTIKLDNKESMCTACFLHYVRHKFRATLGSSKIVKRQSNVLVRFNGSNADVCLLHMIKFALEEEAYKRLYLNIHIIYLDETCIEENENKDAEFRLKKLEEIKRIIEQFPNFTIGYSSIGASTKLINDINSISKDDIEEIINLEAPFVSIFDSFKTLTSRQDFLAEARKNKFRDLAVSLNCSYVFLPDIGIELAKRLISNIALGRGFSVANDVAFCDDSIDGVKFIRPIKDITEKEIESYIKFNNLKYVTAISSEVELGQSIQDLTSRFINGLQENYSSTISTVYKCCSKIAPNRKSAAENKRCQFCKSYLDYHNSETLHAIEFSRCVSNVADDIEKLNNIQDISASHDKLCHACQNIFAEMGNEQKSNFYFS